MSRSLTPRDSLLSHGKCEKKFVYLKLFLRIVVKFYVPKGSLLHRTVVRMS